MLFRYIIKTILLKLIEYELYMHVLHIYLQDLLSSHLVFGIDETLQTLKCVLIHLNKPRFSLLTQVNVQFIYKLNTEKQRTQIHGRFFFLYCTSSVARKKNKSHS